MGQSLSHCAWIAQAPEGKNVRVVLDGVAGKAYAAVDPSSIKIYGEPAKVAYAASDGIDWFVVADGIEGLHCRHVLPESIAAVANPPSLAYECELDGRWVVVRRHKGAEVAYATILPRALATTSATAAPGASGDRGAKPAQPKLEAIAHGPGYDLFGADPPIISPSGDTVTWVAKRERSWYVVQNGVEWFKFMDRPLGEPFLSHDGLHVGWIEHGLNGERLFVDGTPSAASLLIAGDSVCISDPGRPPVYVGWDAGGWSVHSGDQVFHSTSEVVGRPVVAAGGASTAYVIKQPGTGKKVAVRDGEEGPPFADIGSLIFNKAGTRLAYIGYSADRQPSLVVGDATVRLDGAVIGICFAGEPEVRALVRRAGARSSISLLLIKIRVE